MKQVSQAEIEIIHNEAADVNKLYHNFSFDTNVLQSGLDDAVKDPDQVEFGGNVFLADGLDITNRYNLTHQTQVFQPGFEHAIVFNSHQCSGEFGLDYIVSANTTSDSNLRRNGSDWCVNKFRDAVLATPEAPVLLGDASGSTSLTTPQAYVSGIWGITTGHQIWINSGMSEFLNPFIIDQDIVGRKFVDKWIGIRLICKSSQNLVNLLSTKVGFRKYQRHEKK